MKKTIIVACALALAIGFSSCAKTILPVAVTSSAVVSEANFEYIGEVKGVVKANIANIKNFSGALTEMYKNAALQDGEAVINIDYVAIQAKSGVVTLVATGQKIRYKK